MPRVVPKMVLDLIDSAIDGARRQQEQAERGGRVEPFSLTAAEHSAALSGVVALVDQLPPELLVGLSPEDYAALTVNLAAIRNQLATWQYADRDMRRSAFGAVRGYNLNPITVVRHALSKCPNELPAVGLHGLDFIGDERFRTWGRTHYPAGFSRSSSTILRASTAAQDPIPGASSASCRSLGL